MSPYFLEISQYKNKKHLQFINYKLTKISLYLIFLLTTLFNSSWVSASEYQVLSRAEISKIMLQNIYGDNYIPPPATGWYLYDVQPGDYNADWIEKMMHDGFLINCDYYRFCGNSTITKDAFSKIILKAKNGKNFLPTENSGNIYNDILLTTYAANWIEAMHNEGLSEGCVNNKYCPKEVVTKTYLLNTLSKVTTFKSKDSDDDRSPDELEITAGSDPFDPNSKPLDTDYDGTPDILDDDDDGDGYSDEIEIAEGSDPLLSYMTPPDNDYDYIPDSTDPDDDNDGYNDDIELLAGSDPFNSYSKPADNDEDGTPDYADNDDDNDGTDDDIDAFPFNANCINHETGEQCYLEDIVDSLKIEIDSNGIVYFLIEDRNAIYRWDSISKEFLLPATVSEITPSDSKLTLITYSESHNRMYLAYNSGIITYLDLNTETENNFYTLPLEPRGLASVGNYLLAQDATGAWATHFILDINGTLTDSAEWNYFSRVYRWNPQQNRVYFFRDDTSPNDLHYEEIDQNTGAILNDGESPYHGSYNIAPPIVINEDGSKILIGSGSIFNASDLTWAGAVPSNIKDAFWSGTDGLIILRESDDQASTLLVRHNNEIEIVENLTLDGIPRNILPLSEGYLVITERNNSLKLNIYQPSNDSDNDNVTNENDHFPLDPAAAVDSDNDGYPDYWNTGKSQSDSTTGLSLDNYPNNAACYLASHGDGINCDISSTIPNYLPDTSVMGTDGTIYLLSKENNRVFRWSATEEDDLAPIRVGSESSLNATSPKLMTYSSTHNRLYFGYESGRVSYVDLSDTKFEEQDFTYMSAPVGGIGDAGNHILIQDNTGAWNTHYIYDFDSNLKDSADWNHNSDDYAWNSTLNRVYYFAHGSRLKYEEIDLTLGTILSDFENYDNESYYGNNKTIEISPSDDEVLLSNGNIYNASDLTLISTLANSFIAGLWTTDNEIITLREVISGQTRLDRYGSDKFWIEEDNFAGKPIGVFEYDSKYFVVTKGLDEVLFNEYAK